MSSSNEEINGSVLETFEQRLTEDDTSVSQVLVVGGGSVGPFIALRLAQAGVSVTVLEADEQGNTAPRAMAFHPPSIDELEKMGLLEECLQEGLKGGDICWRKRTGELIATMGYDCVRDKMKHPWALLCGQDKMARIVLKRLEKYPNSKVYRDHRVISVEQTETSVQAIAQRSDGSLKRFSASWIVGADGARSVVRKAAGISLTGFTWDSQLVATNVRFDFSKYGWFSGNSIIDPEHWGLIAQISKDDVWRVSYGEKPGLTDQEYLKRLPQKYEAMFPGPRPLKYEVLSFQPYRIHQRCATTFHKGRIVLAGDAAHLCNPMGAMGLNTGITDGAACADALIAIEQGVAAPSLLDDYSKARRDVFCQLSNPRSQGNKRRMDSQDPDRAAEEDTMFVNLKDPVKKKEMALSIMALTTDISKYFPLHPILETVPA